LFARASHHASQALRIASFDAAGATRRARPARTAAHAARRRVAVFVFDATSGSTSASSAVRRPLRSPLHRHRRWLRLHRRPCRRPRRRRFDDRFDGRFDVGRRGGRARVNALHSDPAPLVASSTAAHSAAPPRRWRPRRAGSRGVARAVDAADLGVLPSCLR
jgi:hypothetical protein